MPPDPNTATPESCVAYLSGRTTETPPGDLVESAPVEDVTVRGSRPLETQYFSDSYSATYYFVEKPTYLNSVDAPNAWARGGITYERRNR